MVKKRNTPKIKVNRSPASELLSLGRGSVNTDLAIVENEEIALDDNMLDFSSASAIEEAINSKDLVGKDLRVDDSILPQARNFYEFATSPDFIANIISPYLEQALIGIKLFAEYCPRCSDTEWMKCENHVAQEGLAGIEAHVVMLDFGVCTNCDAGRCEMIKSGELNFYDELALNAGQRGGKSAVVAMLSAYMTHRILKMQKPAEVFGFASNTILHGTFCAITKGQAKENLWDPYYGILLDAPWFQKYHALLKRYESKLGIELFKLRDTFVLYRHRNLLVYPASPDLRVLRGRTRIFYSIDEIAYFDNDKDSSKKTMSAEGTYQALNNSLRTVRSKEGRLLSLDYDEALTGYAMNISSPDNARDKITELVRIAQGSTKMLGLHKPTWEMNPEITRASLAEEFRKNPLEALRNFGAQPPLSSNPFIESRESIENSIKSKGVNYATMKYAIYRTKDRVKQRYAVIDKIFPSKTKSILAMDAGLSNNSFALACGSLTPEGYVSVDLLLDIAPLPDAKLNYTKIYDEIISVIIKARNVTVFLADRWNSPKFLSDAEAEHGLEVAQIYSLKYSDMQDVKTSLDQGSMLIPKPRIDDIDKILAHSPDKYPQCFDHYFVEHLILQMLTVRDTKKGVIKGDGNLTDDLWRATALLHWGLRNEDFHPHLEGEGAVANPIRAQDMAYVAKGIKSSASSSGSRTGSGTKYIGVKHSRK